MVQSPKHLRTRTSLGELLAVAPDAVDPIHAADAAAGIADPLGQFGPKFARLEQGRTVIFRVTVTQELQTIFRAPCYCRVQLLTPARANLYVDFDVDPLEYGIDRLYKAPPLPPAVVVHPFQFVPGQTMIAAAVSGELSFAILVEPILALARGESR